MPSAEDIKRRIEAGIPDARAEVEDLTGGGDHFRATVVSATFAGRSRIEQHRMVYAAVGEAIRAERGGDWELALGADGATWEPWVVDAAGRRHAPFGLVLKELTEWGPDSSLYGVLRGYLG
jgi:stress-induced morphogen